MNYTVYILHSERLDKFYKGYTSDLESRINRHNSGYERFTKCGIPWKLLWAIDKPTRVEAMELERKLKNMNKQKLIAFMEKYA